jgi:hypothetical protein
MTETLKHKTAELERVLVRVAVEHALPLDWLRPLYPAHRRGRGRACRTLVVGPP